MPVLLIIAIVLGVLAGLGLIARLFIDGKASDDRRIATGVSAGLAFLALVLVVLSSITIVSTRNVGVVTAFGKPTGTLSNGLHFVAPWKKVTELSGVIHTENQVGGWNNAKCDGGTAVRLANNSTACVDNTIRWRIVPTEADALFRDYLNDNNIRDSLVTRELNAVLNAVFAAYNPLAADAANGPRLDDLSTKVTDQLKVKIGRQVEVQNVIVSLVHFDQTTQERINAYQAQIASTRIAEESQRTAAAQAAANDILARSVTGEGVLIARCLELVNSGKALPIGFQCFPGVPMPVTIPAR
ncbi:SPFH domain-containing protein [Nocardia brasiliensis]|uniref:SPFH domain-containing protein n=1 Tax=Nocardia brasiliensis TaxID=37326 RepID=UPI002453F2A9|nr:SPFH domain-containing protein [Nocardia brasiliensis]